MMSADAFIQVQIGSGVERRALVKKVWHSQAVKNAIGPSWIFDGNRLAWYVRRTTSGSQP
jgi:eukaryotic translation initiation factor 2C